MNGGGKLSVYGEPEMKCLRYSSDMILDQQTLRVAPPHLEIANNGQPQRVCYTVTNDSNVSMPDPECRSIELRYQIGGGPLSFPANVDSAYHIL